MMQASDTQWQAIKDNDKKQDHLFWYGVKTTGIFCRASCPSRLPKQKNVVIFSSPQEALAAGFRPCKRCRPTEQFVSNQIWVEEINQVLNSHYREKLTLERLADLVHGSPSYLRHVYKALTKKTPQQELTAIRLRVAENALLDSNQSLIQIAKLTGWGSPSYFIQVFKHHYGMTPAQYRKKHSPMPQNSQPYKKET